jgi:hypothetical protein
MTVMAFIAQYCRKGVTCCTFARTLVCRKQEPYRNLQEIKWTAFGFLQIQLSQIGKFPRRSRSCEFLVDGLPGIYAGMPWRGYVNISRQLG